MTMPGTDARSPRNGEAGSPSEHASKALAFPAGFTWGASSAAYQVEGAVKEDGRGPSVWDTFSHTPGKVRGGDTGDVACDAYHRYGEDVALMKSLGLNSYRLSISWPRVQPGGRGAVNQKGLDYYRALLDSLAEHGLTSAVTLYHWDLPQELQDEGGWPVRTTAERFAEFAAIVGEALGDRVTRWITLNEPQVVASHGYLTGEHAPGIRDPRASAAATHHLMLGHGLAMTALRGVLPGGGQIGLSYDLHPALVLGDDPDGVLARAKQVTEANLNGIYTSPVLHGRYPELASPALLPPSELIADGDMAVIGQPVDFLGVNYYSPVYLRAGDPDDLRRHESPASCGLPGVVEYSPEWLPRTAMGWIADADGLHALLTSLAAEAPGLPLYITENGCAAEDYVNTDGVVNDVERISYLRDHFAAASRAISEGVNLAGYYVWSLLDNFEWGWGYQKRFGLVFVDYESQRRIPKASARFYADVIRAGAVTAL